MGSCLSQKKTGSDLTSTEIEAINVTWSRAKQDAVAKRILRELISRRPKFAELFGIKSEDLLLGELGNNRQFLLQAHRIQGFLDTAVGALGHCPMSTIYNMSHRVGQIHYYRGVNFGADNWLIFKRVAVEEISRNKSTKAASSNYDEAIVSPESFSDTVVDEHRLATMAWNKLMTVIIREMKRGFLDEAMKNCTDELAASNMQ